MGVVIEGRVGHVKRGKGADNPEGGTVREAPARTLTPSSTCPGNCFGDLEYTGSSDLYACMDCGTVYHVPIAEHEKTCRFGCGRRVRECSDYGPPCEERLRIHRIYFGEPTPVLDEEKAQDEWAETRTEYRE